MKCFEKLLSTHYIIHAHGNNYGYVYNNIPDTIELTYVNKKNFKNTLELNQNSLPQDKLDFPNNLQMRDIDLNFYPFVTPMFLFCKRNSDGLFKL